MHRRRFLAVTGSVSLMMLAGCSSDKAPPPRESSVVESITTRDTTMSIDLVDRAWVLSRYEGSGARLAPVGVVAAKGGGSGGGRGATGRAAGGHAGAPRTTHGWAWWHGGDYADDWYDKHDDETERYRVELEEIGVRHFGSDSEFKNDRPGAGPVDWDQTYRNPGDRIDHPIKQQGWHRVGAHIVGKRTDHDFDWECVDLKVVPEGDGYAVKNEWKISPRI